MNELKPLVDSINAQLDQIENHFASVTTNYTDQHYLNARQWNMPAVTSTTLSDSILVARELVTNSFSDSGVLGGLVNRPEYIEQLDLMLKHLVSHTLPQANKSATNIVHGVTAISNSLKHWSDSVELNIEKSELIELRTKVNDLVEEHSEAYSDISSLATDIRSTRTRIEHINSSALDVEEKVTLINKAHEELKSLPSTLHDLEMRKDELTQLHDGSMKTAGKLESDQKEMLDHLKSITQCHEDAALLVKQCRNARMLATAEGLSAAFEKKAQELKQTMSYWVIGLIIVLLFGASFGYSHAVQLSELLENEKVSDSRILIKTMLSALSLGGPLWFAWVATSQINKCFKLSEDYSYKASVARAYTGFQEESKLYEDEVSQAVFERTILAFGAPPLRLIDGAEHNSPVHEGLSTAANSGMFSWFSKKRNTQSDKPKENVA